MLTGVHDVDSVAHIRCEGQNGIPAIEIGGLCLAHLIRGHQTVDAV